MTVQDWNTEQIVLASPTFDPVHLAWQALFDAEGLNPTAAWLTANPEPLLKTYKAGPLEMYVILRAVFLRAPM